MLFATGSKTTNSCTEMANPFKKSNQGNSPKGSLNAKLITTAVFLSTYFESGKDFMRYGESLRDTEVEDLRKFFSFLKVGLRMDGNVQKRTDRAERTYVYPRFYQARATPGCKVILEGKLEQFMEEVQNGDIVTDFTLDDLISEASKG